MFPYLRLARGYGALDRCRWLLTAATSAIVAALLLRALGRALTSPGAEDPRVGLLWCLPALAALGFLAAGWARSLPLQGRARVTGLLAAGAGPLRARLLLAGEIALACTFGALLALLGFLVLRAHWLELEPSHSTRFDFALGVHASLPFAGTATLIALVPLLGGLTAAAAVRSADLLPGDGADRPQRRLSVPYLAVAVGLLAAGAVTEVAGLRQDGTAAAVTGWAIAVSGVALAVPALLYLTGGLLAWGQPRSVRLLAGRGLQADSWRLGTPLAVLAVTGAACSVMLRRIADGHGPGGPLPLIDAVLLGVSVLGALFTRLAELVVARQDAYASLDRMGASGWVLRKSAVLRGGAATAVLLAAGTGAAALAASALQF